MNILTMKVPRESDWLSAPGGYQDDISTLCASDPRPRLESVDEIMVRLPVPADVFLLTGVGSRGPTACSER